MMAIPEPPNGEEPKPDGQRHAAPAVRASDGEREQVVQVLSEHATTGRLTLAELEERVELAYAATTRGELAELTTDLPAIAPATPGHEGSAAVPARRRKVTRWIVAFMGGSEKRGRWRVGERVNAIAVMGGHDIDLRNAELDSDDITILAISVMGGIDIYVPDTIDVEVSGFSIMGGTGERGSRRPPRPGAPRIRVLAYNLMGGADVWRLPEETINQPLREAKRVAKNAQ